MDDIEGLTAASETGKPGTDVQPNPAQPRSVGPESEVRRGPEAPSDAEDTEASDAGA
jgi:hypothetical protein